MTLHHTFSVYQGKIAKLDSIETSKELEGLFNENGLSNSNNNNTNSNTLTETLSTSDIIDEILKEIKILLPHIDESVLKLSSLEEFLKKTLEKRDDCTESYVGKSCIYNKIKL